MRTSNPVWSITRYASQHQAGHRQVHHCFATISQVFVILTHPPIPTDPGYRSLNNPSAREMTETWHRWRFNIYWIPAPLSRTLDNFQLPSTYLLNPLLECRAPVAHISPNHLQSRTVNLSCSENKEGSLSIRYPCRVRDGTQQQTSCINDNVAFTPADFLRSVVTVNPPFSVVFTDCESMMAAEGWAARPIISRSFS